MNPSPSFRSGYIAIVGWPNVGKSSLLNAFLGQQLSIVSPKPQTTRDAVRGILNEEGAQLIFVDTPGWLKPNDVFQSFMKKAIMQSLYDDADLVLWVVEPRPLSNDQHTLADTLAKLSVPVVVALNKIDTAEPGAAYRMNEELKAHFPAGVTLLPVSATTLQGISDLKRKLAALLPIGPAYFPTDQISDRWERFFASECLREAVLALYGQEVPHATAVVIEEFVEKEGRKDHIRAILYVETEGQQKILVGKGGQAIKQLGQRARLAMEKMLARDVFLELKVKVKKDWRKDAVFVKQLHETA